MITEDMAFMWAIGAMICAAYSICAVLITRWMHEMEALTPPPPLPQWICNALGAVWPLTLAVCVGIGIWQRYKEAGK